MINNLSPICWLLLALSACTLKVSATEVTVATLWSKLSQVLTQQNFIIEFVSIDGVDVKPFQWLHGNQHGQQLERVSALNGIPFEIVRRNNTVSYFQGDQTPYSVFASHITDPLPAILYSDLTQLEQHYSLTLAGKQRIINKESQLIRVLSKDKHRYHYLIWLDLDSGMLLKFAMLSNQQKILQQIQVTHFHTTETPAKPLLLLAEADLPQHVQLALSPPQEANFHWLPQGFKVISQDQHLLPIIRQPTNYFLISDGIVEFSVFVRRLQQKFSPTLAIQKGSMTIVKQIRQGVEIAVVGKIPQQTAQKIADSVILAP